MTAPTLKSRAVLARPPVKLQGKGPRAPLRPKGPVLGRPPGRFTQHKKLSRLHDLLEKHPQGLTIPEMANALRLTSRSIRRYLRYLQGPDAQDTLESVALGTRGALRWRISPRDRGRAMNLRRTQAYGLLAVQKAFDALRGSALFEELEVVRLQILQLARRPVRAGGGADIASDTRMEERFVHVPEASSAYTQKGAELDDVFRAVADLRVLTFRYVQPRVGSTQGEAPRERGTRVTLHPYAMVLYRGGVHCLGRDTRTGQVEAFSLGRMRDSEPSESARFELPDDFKVEDFVHGPFGLGRAKHDIVVEFSPQVADEIRGQRLDAKQRVATAPDGRLRLSVSVPSLAEAAAWVLRFGASARVVEPPELRDAVIRELRGAMLRYGR